MSNPRGRVPYKLTRVVGASDAGFEQAAQAALAISAEAVRGHAWASVADISANLGESGPVDRWQVTREVAPEVEEEGRSDLSGQIGQADSLTPDILLPVGPY